MPEHFMNTCPRCGQPAQRWPAGMRRNKPYPEFWKCNATPIPCLDTPFLGKTGVLTWKSARQWHFLHRSHSTTPRPAKGRVRLIT